MNGNERRAELHRRDGDALVRPRRALLPLGLLALSACGKLEIGSYGAAESDGARSGSGPAHGAGLGGMPAGASEAGAGEAGAGEAGAGEAGAGEAGAGSGGVSSSSGVEGGGAAGESEPGSAAAGGSDAGAGGAGTGGAGTGGAGAGGAGTGGAGAGGASTGGMSAGGSGGNAGSVTSGGAGPLSGAFESADIGDTGAPGTTAFDGGAYTLDASGADIETVADSFRFLYRCLNGDGQVVARIEDVVSAHAWTKVGVMIRDSLAADAKNVFMLLRPSEGSAFQYRPGTGASTMSSWQDSPADFTPEHAVRYLKPPKWLKLTRRGHEFSAYSSDDGECWWQRATRSLAFDEHDDEACFGVALTAANYGDIARATVSNLEVSSAIEPDNVRCGRANADGDLPPPPEDAWIVPPARFGESKWDYTTENPNGTPSGVKCDPWAEDQPNAWIAPRTDGPDHPNCPDPTASPAWTKLDYPYDWSWENDLDVGIGAPPGRPADALSTFVEARRIWLRTEFTLASDSQKDDLMFWGRWADGITVYLNGVLATWNSAGSSEYRYLGVRTAARDALVVGGRNVVAVRLEWDRYDFWEQPGVIEVDAWDRFFDLGLTTNDRLAALPLERAAEPSADVALYVDTVKQFVQEQAISGATFAISKNGAIVASAALGWHDKNLDVPMARGAKLRLATNDEIITQAVITKLVNEGALAPSTKVFQELNLTPIPGHEKGSNVDGITVEQLRTHKSGIGATVHDQTMLDELAFHFGISPDQWTTEHNARWLYSLDAEVGTPGSPRDASFLLRYLAERLLAPQSLQDYLTDDMGLDGIAVSHERLTGREPNEGYITRQPTWDRWLALENYLALGASAEAYASFLDDFSLSYELTPEGTYRPIEGGGVAGGMPGTWSVALEDPVRRLSIVMIVNSHGNFDEVVSRIDRITYGGDPCLFGHEDPRALLENVHFMRNAGEPELYVNLEAGLAATPAHSGQWSAQWWFEPVGNTHFRLKNRWTEEYLVLEGGLLDVSSSVPDSPGTEWQLVPAGDAFQLRNRAGSELLYVEDGELVSSPSATGPNTEWRFCN
jgi:hypothetical protein